MTRHSDESSKKHRAIPVAPKRIGEGTRICGVHAPFTAVFGDGLSAIRGCLVNYGFERRWLRYPLPRFHRNPLSPKACGSPVPHIATCIFWIRNDVIDIQGFPLFPVSSNPSLIELARDFGTTLQPVAGAR